MAFTVLAELRYLVSTKHDNMFTQGCRCCTFGWFKIVDCGLNNTHDCRKEHFYRHFHTNRVFPGDRVDYMRISRHHFCRIDHGENLFKQDFTDSFGHIIAIKEHISSLLAGRFDNHNLHSQVTKTLLT